MLALAHPTPRVYRHHGQAMTVMVPAGSKNLPALEPDSSAAQSDSAIWIPPINKTVATEGKGIAEVAEAIAKHAEHLRITGDWASRDRARLRSELETALQEALMSRFFKNIQNKTYNEVVEQVVERTLSPHEAVKKLLNGNSKQEKV